MKIVAEPQHMCFGVFSLRLKIGREMLATCWWSSKAVKTTFKTVKVNNLMTKKYVAQPFKKDRVFADALKKVSKLQQETARNSSSISIKDTRSQWFKILKNVSLFENRKTHSLNHIWC